MKLTAIVMARALAFVEIEELNPKGKAYYPDIVAALVERFKFQKYPTKPEDFDETKGVQFADGKFADGTLDRVQLFTHGIVIDTRVSTAVSAALLNDTLLWAKSALGMHYEESMVKRRAFVSQVTFESNLKLVKLNPILEKAGSVISSSLSTSTGQPIHFEPTGIVLSLDQSVSKLAPGTFTLERRAEIPFADNKYFSSAPLSTDEHLKLLQEFEKVLL
jgi:hypothetical protein